MAQESIGFEDVERQLLESHLSSYYSWIKHVVTLSSGSLTLLVALQNSYIPPNVKNLFLLKISFIFLALTILTGIIALYGEAQTPLDAIYNIRKLRSKKMTKRLLKC
jgi:hypothetical protein